MMKKNSRVAQVLGIEYPVMNAPMNWLTDYRLAAAVSNAGGLGLLGLNAGQTSVTADPIENAERMREQIRKTRELTDKPIAAELIIMGDADIFSEKLLQVYEEEDIQAVLCLNDVPKSYVDRIHAAGKKAIYKHIWATKAGFAKAEADGFDVVVVAGCDTGGHMNNRNIGLLTAVRMAREATSLPVCVAGGIIDGLDVQIVGMLGGEGLYVGTRFVACVENPAADITKQMMLELDVDDLVQVCGMHGPIHSMKTHTTDKIMKIRETRGDDANKEVTNLYRAGYREAMLKGNYECPEGVLLDVNSGIGRIKEILTAKEIIEEFAKGME